MNEHWVIILIDAEKGISQNSISIHGKKNPTVKQILMGLEIESFLDMISRIYMLTQRL